mmetsp:Transcript_35489/g.57142  ORF Transcript_35489/g.57142 Transcript_35489/m.57142 type:complete len:432 (-) Transcript_35489:5887-7182(-)
MLRQSERRVHEGSLVLLLRALSALLWTIEERLTPLERASILGVQELGVTEALVVGVEVLQTLPPPLLLLVEDAETAILELECAGAIADAQPLSYSPPEAVHGCIVLEGADGVQGLPARRILLLNPVEALVLVGTCSSLLGQLSQILRGNKDHDSMSEGHVMGHRLELRFNLGVLLQLSLFQACLHKFVLKLVHALTEEDLDSVSMARLVSFFLHLGLDVLKLFSCLWIVLRIILPQRRDPLGRFEFRLRWKRPKVNAKLFFVTEDSQQVVVLEPLVLPVGERKVIGLLRPFLEGACHQRDRRLFIELWITRCLLCLGLEEDLVEARHLRVVPAVSIKARRNLALLTHHEGLVLDVDANVWVASCPPEASVCCAETLCPDDLQRQHSSVQLLHMLCPRGQVCGALWQVRHFLQGTIPGGLDEKAALSHLIGG